MKATEMLKGQHRQVKSLCKQVAKTEAADERRRLMDEIGKRLQIHTTIEEEIFYPAVRGLGTRKAEVMIDEALEEHHVQEEESEMFTVAQLLGDEVADLAKRMEARQSELEAQGDRRAA